MAVDDDDTQYDTVERNVAAALFTQHYEDLANLARARRRQSKSSDTMMTEDTPHEGFVRLTVPVAE